MKNMGKLIIVILCLMCTTVLFTTVVSADKIKETNEVISSGSYKSVMLLGLTEGEEIEVSVEVVSPTGGLVDVYILPSSDYFNYPDDPFSPELSREGVTTTTFTFKTPDTSGYYLIIDNVDNYRTTDTVPTGSITVDYEYDDPLEEWTKAAEAIALTCILGIVAIVVIIVVIIVVVVLLLAKKEKPPQYPPQYPQQPQTQYPGYQQYPQYPQQPYQPPPQQPPQQPPPGQPPGQPPGT